jgi:PAS domain S-box-containing protein
MTKPLHVLQVEDSEDDAFLILRALRKDGFDVISERVETGDALRSSLEKGGWDVVLSDYSLPRLNGLKALELVRESGLKQPFIIVSGAIGEDRAVELMKAGAHDYVRKDSLVRLVPAIERALEDFQMRRERESAIKALAESEERFRAIADYTYDWEVWVAPDGKLLWMNSAVERITGYTREEYMALSENLRDRVSLIFFHEDQQMLAELLEQGLTNRVSLNDAHIRIRRKNGGIRWVSLSSQPIYGTGGVYLGLRNSIRDITERKQAEDALERERAQLLLIFDSISAIVDIIDPRTYEILYMNKYARGIFGSHPLGKLCYSVFHKYDTPCKGCNNEELLKNKDRLFSWEYYSKIAQRHFLTTNRIIKWPDGRDVKFEFSIDITERKEMEAHLLTEKNRLTSVIENIPGIVSLLRPDYEITYANHMYKKRFGDPPPGKKCYDHIFGAKIPCVNCKAIKSLETGTPHFWEASDAENRYYQMVSALIQNFDGSPILLEIGIDITEKKQTELEKARLEKQLRQSQKMEAVGTLAGGIAHDFNNILGIILGNAELASDDVPDWNPARHNLEQIKTASLRARDVVRQLLSFSRKEEQTRQPVDISSLIKESLKLLRASIPASIQIRESISGPYETIWADPTQIHQVLINLCANAAYAMSEKGGILDVGLENVLLDKTGAALYHGLTEGRYVKLSVSDTGTGIPPEIKDFIFDPYFTTKEVGKGTGMGLAVVHSIVKNHKGAISVYSEPGRGTVFKIFFPSASRQVVEKSKPSNHFPAGNNEKILFVDDEVLLLDMGKQLMERLGYQVDIRANPMDALETFRSDPHEFDLVITDMTMPHMTGDTLIRAMKDIRPDIPVILCTGFSEKVNEEMAREMGIDKYIEKPLRKNEISLAIREILDRYKTMEKSING